MLLIQELARLLYQALSQAVATRRLGLLALIVLAGIIVAISATTTVVGPVAIYPFL